MCQSGILLEQEGAKAGAEEIVQRAEGLIRHEAPYSAQVSQQDTPLHIDQLGEHLFCRRR